ncbi:MAG: hypothetical protein IJW92_04060 [Clostridia bacterium]|nr:hypothetical protein [Clostridia bacterium]
MNWDEIYSSVKRFASRAADKINQSADIATLQVKLSMAEKKLDDAYCLLGQIAYRHFTSDSDESAKVAAAIANVDSIKQEIGALKDQIAQAKARAAEDNKEAEEESEAAAKPQSDATAEESPVAQENAVPEQLVAATEETPVAEQVSSISDAEDAVEITVEETAE